MGYFGKPHFISNTKRLEVELKGLALKNDVVRYERTNSN
jgi:hypothetical protein